VEMSKTRDEMVKELVPFIEMLGKILGELKDSIEENNYNNKLTNKIVLSFMEEAIERMKEDSEERKRMLDTYKTGANDAKNKRR
jgi:hypothetical protein